MNLTSNNPAKVERNVTIAQGRIAGATYQELADQHDVSKTTVHRILHDSEIKDVVDTGTRYLVSMIPLAVDNYLTFLTDKDHPEHYKASKDCLQTTGILASHTQSLTINNILNVQAGPQSGDVLRLQELIAARHDLDVIDIPPESGD